VNHGLQWEAFGRDGWRITGCKGSLREGGREGRREDVEKGKGREGGWKV